MLEIVLAIIALIVAAVALIVTQSKGVAKEPPQDIILAITNDFSKRLNKLEGKIVDLQVRLDILETQIGKSARELKLRQPKEESYGAVISQSGGSEITKLGSDLGEFELSILRCIRDGARTPSEIREVVKRSREHVARSLKRLYVEGLVDRRGGRPFVYSLTDKGTAALDRVATGV